MCLIIQYYLIYFIVGFIYEASPVHFRHFERDQLSSFSVISNEINPSLMEERSHSKKSSNEISPSLKAQSRWRLAKFRHLERDQFSSFPVISNEVNPSLMEDRSHSKKPLMRSLHRKKLIEMTIYFFYQLMLTFTPSLKFSKPNNNVFDFSSQLFCVSGKFLPAVLAVIFVGLSANKMRMMLFVFDGLFAKN